jgi:hypothetical protein
MTETTFQEAFMDACKALAKSGNAPHNHVVPFSRVELDHIHGTGAWRESDPYLQYTTFVEEEATSQSGLTTSSRSRGPTKPDLMISALVDEVYHAVWICELKFVPKDDITNDTTWAEVHTKGLAQGIWYLYAANTLCGAALGMVQVNACFQRLMVLNGEPDVMLVEVVKGSQKEDLLDSFGEYKFGRQAFPNVLPCHWDISDVDTAKGTPTFRFHQQLVEALEEAEDRVTSRRGCKEKVHERTAPDFDHKIRLSNTPATMGKILPKTQTYSKAVAAAEKAAIRKKKKADAKAANRIGDGPKGGGGGDGGAAGGQSGAPGAGPAGGNGGEGEGDGGGGTIGGGPGGEGDGEGDARRGGDGEGGGAMEKGKGRAHHAAKADSGYGQIESDRGVSDRSRMAIIMWPQVLPDTLKHFAFFCLVKQLIDPVGSEAEHAVGGSVQDWVEGQAGCEMEPNPNATATSSSCRQVGEVAVDLIGLSDIKQRSSDADLLTMDRVARVMRENGWRFQFVSPEEMDRRMEELSARRREFSG